MINLIFLVLYMRRHRFYLYSLYPFSSLAILSALSTLPLSKLRLTLKNVISCIYHIMKIVKLFVHFDLWPLKLDKDWHYTLKSLFTTASHLLAVAVIIEGADLLRRKALLFSFSLSDFPLHLLVMHLYVSDLYLWIMFSEIKHNKFTVYYVCQNWAWPWRMSDLVIFIIPWISEYPFT